MLQDKSVLIQLSISLWSGRKLDKSITSVVNNMYSATDSGRFNKLIIESVHYDNIVKIANTARAVHNELTLPWLSDGTRILPTALYFKYNERINAITQNFNQAVSLFLDNYPEIIEANKERLGNLFKDTDYPEINKLADKFRIETHVMPVPHEDDFRVDITNAELAQIKQALRHDSEEIMGNAVLSVVQRMKVLIERLYERLNDSGNKFKDSLVNNIADLIGVLPQLNVTNSPIIAELTSDLDSLIQGVCPKDLRKDKEVRETVCTKAAEIKDKMDVYIQSMATNV